MEAIDCIEACAVVKKPDKELLYVGKAYIVLKQGTESVEETKKYIFEQGRKELVMPSGERLQLKPNEIPSDIEFIAGLPRTKADKVDYQELERKTTI